MAEPGLADTAQHAVDRKGGETQGGWGGMLAMLHAMSKWKGLGFGKLKMEALRSLILVHRFYLT